ncbi:MAG: DNA topoisomerase IB [bacterium]|nr:DNA topoisomerase IB [bacterium]
MLSHDPELELLLEAAELRYINPDMAGYTRKRRGKSFTYLDSRGNPIKEAKLKEWIDSLRIPPAWEDVWICPKRNGHLLATGRDSSGRKQYIYHPRWNQLANEKKFESLVSFGESLPALRETVEAHLRKPDLTREKVLALLVTLLERTMIRIGNSEYARGNDSYGLTTLQDDHVSVSGSKITFEFVGKSGKEHAITLADKRLAKLVKSCQDIPGQHLFQYNDQEKGTRHALGSYDVNAYLYSITDKPFTAKTFRTWGGSVLMADLLRGMPPADTKKAKEAQVRDAMKQVAERLGNTVAVCRKYYVHPAVVQAHMDDALRDFYDPTYEAETRFSLRPDEHMLMQFLRAATITGQAEAAEGSRSGENQGDVRA